ncbi:hydroxyacid dehydrogenase [Pedobacter sp. HMWF019]|uniref:D-2-hydroxyacid dehydrogenase family protein n=1 Tax=Pedobacter sp. HMWF019 TaxID=2056856 RepID=UPI000D3D6421|nr:D-2-hydroxyacid dehydrogenase family protein [Pedobacter sp. HMWF019]PTT03815.1 hydroxyacid dehydrogenase [Pedobacter sp. HMWF019]
MDKAIQIAVLDDYQKVALKTADWTKIEQFADVVVFDDHLDQEGAIVERLLPFQILCVMRERTPLTRSILSKLSHLKLIVSTGRRNASIDIRACEEFGIELQHTDYVESGAPELTWALLMAMARNIIFENQNFRSGKWQSTVGTDLSGKTLGLVGLGRIGQKMAKFAKAFDMDVIAWSQNLTAEKAAAAGANLVSKAELFRTADFVSIHLVLSERSKGIVGAEELALMKKEAYLINTSRGPLIDEASLIDTLKYKRIAGAALDVFDREPLPENHILRKLDRVVATPHIGYVTEKTYRVFYGNTVSIIEQWLKEHFV